MQMSRIMHFFIINDDDTNQVEIEGDDERSIKEQTHYECMYT